MKATIMANDLQVSSDEQAPIGTLGAVILTGLAYGIMARLCLSFVSLPGDITPVWLSSGIALAAVLIFGKRVWFGIMLGILILSLTRGIELTGSQFLVDLVSGVGNTASALIAANLITRMIKGRNLLSQTTDLIRFTLVAMISTCLSATVGIISLSIANPELWDQFGILWGNWWLSNVFGILLLTPALLTWYEWWQTKPHLSWVQMLEVCLTSIGAIAISLLVFRYGLPLEYLLIPLLIWAVFRVGLFLSMLLILLIVIIAILGTADSQGPFVQAGRDQFVSLLLLQLFIGINLFTVLLISAVISEREGVRKQLKQSNDELADMADKLQQSNGELVDLTEQLRQSNHALKQANLELEQHVDHQNNSLSVSEEKFSKAFRSSPNPIIISRLSDGVILDVNDSFVNLSGYERETVLNQPSIATGLWVDPNLRGLMVQRLQEFGTMRDYEAEFRIQSGEVRVGLLSVEIIQLDGEPCLLSLVNDITDRKQAEEALKQEQARSEKLLLNILPGPIADRLKAHGTGDRSMSDAIAENFDEVSILFADIVGFTPLSEKLEPIEIVNLLNKVFSSFDQMVDQLGLEKIKTIGDAYMVAAGLPDPRSDHAEAIADMALEMQSAMSHFSEELGQPLQLRIGINSGIVVAGVIGQKKFIYDLWGDAVNIASRMESSAEPGGIQVTETTYHLLKDRYKLEERGRIPVKGKGQMTTFWLLGKKVSLSSSSLVHNIG